MFLMPIRYCKPHDNIIFKVNALQWFYGVWLKGVIQSFYAWLRYWLDFPPDKQAGRLKVFRRPALQPATDAGSVSRGCNPTKRKQLYRINRLESRLWVTALAAEPKLPVCFV